MSRIAQATHLLLLAVCGLVVLHTARFSVENLIDDALITLTYSKNIALGNGPVYNWGPPSAGASSPLQMLLMALLARLGGIDLLPLLASMASAVFLVLAALQVRLFHRELGLTTATALCVGLLWLGIPSYYQGGESALFLLLLFVALVLWGAGHTVAFGVAVGALFLTRGEGALLGALWGMERLVIAARGDAAARKACFREGVRALGGFLVVVLPWWIYAYRTFGAILPNTLGVKAGSAGVDGTMSFARALLQGEPLAWGMSLVGPWRGLLWIPALHGLIVGVRTNVMWRRYAAFCGAYALGYVALRVPNFPWYHVPLHFLWLGCIGISMGTGIAWIAQPGRGRLVRGVVAVVLVVCVAAVSLRFSWTSAPMATDPRVRPYREVVWWVNAHLQRGATLATREVGYLGFHLPHRILDLDGLTAPELAPLVRANRRDELIRERQPDAYVMAYQKAEGAPPGLISIAGVVFQRVQVFESAESWPLVYGLYLNARTRALLPGVERPAPPPGAILVRIGADKI